jgi:hypothetical protein
VATGVYTKTLNGPFPTGTINATLTCDGTDSALSGGFQTSGAGMAIVKPIGVANGSQTRPTGYQFGFNDPTNTINEVWITCTH